MKTNCAIMEEEIYLSINGASRQEIGDSAFHNGSRLCVGVAQLITKL